MTEIELVLVLGILIVLVVGVLLFRSGAGTWNVSVGKLFHSELKLGAGERRSVDESIERAARERGQAGDGAGAIEYPKSIPIRRTLWVDDNPDYNVYETVALERLGLAVTKTTASDAAFVYRAKQPYAVLIVDLGRPADSLAGLDFVREAKRRSPDSAIVIYTMNPRISLADVRAAGATAMTTTPHELVGAVLAGLVLGEA